MLNISELIKECTPVNEDTYRLFCEELFQADLLFHPEDSAESIVNIATGARIFTRNDAALIGAYLQEVFDVLDDPCKVALGVKDAEGRRRDRQDEERQVHNG